MMKKTGFALGLLLFSAAALADNILGTTGKLNDGSVWTIYAFGNAQTVADTLRAVSNFSSSWLFQTIATLIATVGILVVGMTGGFSAAAGGRVISYVVGVLLVVYLLFGYGMDGPLRVQVEVTDVVDLSWKAPVTVPAVVGVPAALISTAGYQISQQVEASFSIPDALKLSNGAPFNLPAALMADASQAQITNPAISQSLAYFVQDCFTVSIVQGTADAATLTTSTNFLNDLVTSAKDQGAIMVATKLDEAGVASYNDVVSCTKAIARIKLAIDNSGVGGQDFLTKATAWSTTPAASVFATQADAVMASLSADTVTSAATPIKQAAVLQAFSQSFKDAAISTGNNDALSVLATAQALKTQRTGWIEAAEIFNRSMGYIYAVLQVFVYALIPLVMAAALIPGLGVALLKNFGQILLWLAIWPPMLAIVNFIIISMQQAELGGAFMGAAGDYGFTLANMGVITEKTANMRAAAVFIGTMVPPLAWAMVKGSIDFSRFIAAGAGEQFAAQAANTQATGNFSLNQASMDSFTANKRSIGQTNDHDGFLSSHGSIGTATEKFGGGADGLNAGGSTFRLGQGANSSLNTQATLGSNVAKNTGEMHNTGSNAALNGAQTSGGSTTLANVNNSSQSTDLSASGGARASKDITAGDPAVDMRHRGPGGGGAGGGAGQGQVGKDGSVKARGLVDPAKDMAAKGAGKITPNTSLSTSLDKTERSSVANSQALTRQSTAGNTRTDQRGITNGRTGSDGVSTSRTAGHSDSASSGFSQNVEGVYNALAQSVAALEYKQALKGGASWSHNSQEYKDAVAGALGSDMNAVANQIRTLTGDGFGSAHSQMTRSAEAEEQRLAAEQKALELKRKKEQAENLAFANHQGGGPALAGPHSEPSIGDLPTAGKIADKLSAGIATAEHELALMGSEIGGGPSAKEFMSSHMADYGLFDGKKKK